MSKIFRAFEKAWEHRHASPLAVVQPEPAEKSTAAPANGRTVTAERPQDAAPCAISLAARAQSRRIQPAAGAPVLPFDGSSPQAAEQYKIIRTKILHHVARPRSLVVSSAQTEDGKSITALNIAGCLALKENTSVLLVDADMRRSKLAETLGLAHAPGLAEVLEGRVAVDQAVVRLEPFSNLFFLACGEPSSSPTELLDSGRWRALAAMLKREFDFVLIDAPPAGMVADYDLVEHVADGVILVLRPDHTNRALGLKALAGIPAGRLIGVVMNCVPDWFLTRPFGHSYHSYYHD